ncbi:protein ALTERED PHOSPHATE STARVATION RESPONSE 1-like [Phoenix dactylifera]|uniref:Protein ALTERED PHOSPHATE STARVATION RESPONSE 1-like n=1 Tax=Phoenix dactylifera TaxID=42345 RepID=A0A8B7D188_PHODC|nr:protein ALTERED PHOSPHATE STARVATION RESPONSE 1-like [Phoenix dactylifera]
MGCRSSKAEEPAVVGLCRERKELIRAAADYRYALAGAHTAYFRALDRVGEALNRFVQEELAAAAAAQPPALASPVITLPPSDGKGKDKAKARRSGGDGNAGDVGASSSSSLRSNSHAHSSDRHLHFPSDSDSEEISEEEDEEVPEVPQERSRKNEGLQRGGGRGGGEEKSSSPPPPNPSPPFAPFPPLSAVPPPFYAVYPPVSNYPVPPSSSYPLSPFSAVPPPYSNYPIPNYYYMKSSATIPTTIYQEPYTGWSDSGYMGYGYGYTNPLYDNPMGPPAAAPVEDESFHRNREVRTATPPPPQQGGSSWDFFNPFDSYEQFYSEFLKEKYGMGSVTSSPNSSEVREREGIPDLEEETEQEIVKEDVETRKEVDGSSGDKDSVAESSKAAEVEREVGEKEATVVSEVKESQSNSEVSEVKGSGEKEAHRRKKGASFEEETSLVTEDSGPSKESAVYAHGTRDVAEAVKEIKEQFKSAATSGEEVSRMLEVGKLRYRSRRRILRVIFSWILDSMTAPGSTSSRAVVEKYIDVEPDKLSATLDKLYIWEKKLQKEVQEEEKLRIIYDREWRRLKALDDSGAESYEIDSTRASIRKLLTRINIAIRSVDTISSRIHKLRDEELRPQLIELIQGLIRMWNSILDCHRRQFQAIIESKSQSLIVKTGIQRNSAAKVTIELELELLNWCSCFGNWIRTQKSYIEALNGWLMKWLLQEKEETPDGVIPFSPSRIGAPAAFIISNDWYHMIERISEAEVIKAIRSFAVSVHGLWERQDEEQRQKLKAEYLSKDFARRLRSLQKESGMHGYLDVSDKTAISVSNNVGASHDDHMMALDEMKKRVDEERARHEETIKEVQEVAASNLRMGLIPIFEALGNFTSETLKGYEQVRIPNGSAGT